MTYKALLLTKNKDNNVVCNVTNVSEQNNPDLNVKVKVSYSTLNYKDCLAISGAPGIVRNYPMIPGIDFVGEVIEENNSEFKIGEQVILNGYGVGEKYWGGLAQIVNAKSDWLIKKPEKFSAKDSMSIGTAGYTAMLCVMELLDNGVLANKDDILVTGATGGVGCISLIILSKMGFKVTALTGKRDKTEFLKSLGVNQIIYREDFSVPHKILEKQKWGGAVDTVGGSTLGKVCAEMKYSGTVVACGNAESLNLNTTVAPFILRNIRLIGIDSVYQKKSNRILAWNKLSEILDGETLKNISTTINLTEVTKYVNAIIKGNNTGRIVVDINNS